MIRLIIADDHTVLREALSEMLSKKGGYEVVGQAKDGEELLKVIQLKQADVIIMDVSMPGLDGISALERMSSVGFKVPVLMLSADEGARTVRSAIRAGARGFMPKNASIEELRFAIESVLKGQTYLSPSVTSSLMSGDGTNGNALSVLTKREIEILRYLADGSPNREIGKKLHISTRTVDTHRSNILKKLNVRTNAELVKLAISNGLINV